MPSTSRSFLSAAALCLLAVSIPLPATGQDRNEEGELTQEELIDRILELREQIEALLETLPPELQEEVERRWRDRAVIEDEPAESVQADATGESVLPEGKPSTPPPATPIPVTQPDEVPQQTAVPVPEPTEPEASAPEQAEPTVAAETTAADEDASTRRDSAVASPPCGGFHLLDTNQDGVISGGDRHWRFLRLWFDGDGNDTIDDSEIESLFELGVRQIGVDLKSYQNDEGSSEDVDATDLVWLRQLGRGKNKRRSGVLIVDAGRLVRDGRIWLVTADGTQLDGFEPLGSAVLLETRDGDRLPILCGASP